MSSSLRFEAQYCSNLVLILGVVTEEPHVRFLAAVPLRSPGSSTVIGNYIVADDKPREGLNESEIEFIMDMGVTVMDYLEAGLIKKKQYRSERMIKAIGLFIEGKSTLRDWWLEWGHRIQQPTQKRKRHAAPLEKLADDEFGVQEPVPNLSKGLEQWPEDETLLPHTPSSVSGVSRTDVGDGRPMMLRGESHLTSSDSYGSATQSTLMSKSWKDRNSSVTTLDTLVEPNPDRNENKASVAFDLPAPSLTDDRDVSKELQDALVSSEMKTVFSRASNLIREAIGVQGVIFFDASVGSFGGNLDRNGMDDKAPGAFHIDPTASSEDELCRKQSAAEIDVNGTSHSDSANHMEKPQENTCNILGFSTRRRSSLRGHGPSNEYGKLPESMLKRLLKRYPHGKIFNFDEDGSFSDSDTTSSCGMPKTNTEKMTPPQENKSRRQRHSKEAEAKAILEVLPGARSVFWFPLWDQNRERWFSGSLIWSNSPTRVMCPMEDLTYLAAFGNSAMAEVSRISARKSPSLLLTMSLNYSVYFEIIFPNFKLTHIPTQFEEELLALYNKGGYYLVKDCECFTMVKTIALDVLVRLSLEGSDNCLITPFLEAGMKRESGAAFLVHYDQAGISYSFLARPNISQILHFEVR